MSRRIILLVDDDENFRDTLVQRMESRGFDVVAVSSGTEALQMAAANEPTLAVVDMRMPDMDGLETIARLHELRPEMRTALLTGYGGNALRQAAQAQHAEYFEKQNMARLWERLESLKAEPQPGDHISAAGGADGWPEESERNIIGQTKTMQQLKRDVDMVAALDCTVLLLGETGTGKELLARTIHRKSSRTRGRFLAVNCGSFSHDLLSRELFGQEPEAGGGRGSTGLFETASGGTILLDEVGDTPLPMQSQLLRMLQDRTIHRVGGGQEVHVDVRIMATSNQDLKAKIRAGQFREDFYYRLNVFTLHVPPLRERRDDIPPLCNYFLACYNQSFGLNVDGFEAEVMDMLMDYPYPGNVRELESIVERGVIVRREGVIRREDLPRRFQEPGAAPQKTGSGRHQGERLPSLAEIEEEHIRRVMAAVGHNKLEAAKVLGISRAGLWRKLKKMDEADAATQ
ncbi:sigma-54-dependent transcriptional regulator [Pseudodesulfovibrio pelocollis]|uniref:sigma-54-dependent transcriptional regulator n=1 Tax=Pseudodesulfovibrio pelocollis TaxID=3051432 RepID=UPI00255B318D|nr:sigma-54 dependent transcriptional regulator [Pseudodesulfovibrio sp. SB368]